MSKGPLRDGIVGGLMVQWFFDNEDPNNLPVEAEHLEYLSKTEINYRLTFEDESVSDWKFTIHPVGIFHILAADKYNDIL